MELTWSIEHRYKLTYILTHCHLLAKTCLPFLSVTFLFEKLTLIKNINNLEILIFLPLSKVRTF